MRCFLACVLLCWAAGEIAGQRELVTGEPCDLPFTFSGEVYTDCLRFGGREWCFAGNGIFGVCAADADTAAAVETEPESPVKRNEDDVDMSMDCCTLLREIGFESNLPVMLIDTKGREIPDEPKIEGSLCTCDFSSQEETMHLIGVEIRGSTSARDFVKKSYALETRDEAGNDMDVSFFGFPKESDWVLYGPELDLSMGMRTYLTMQLYRSAGNYASNVQFCEVFVLDDDEPFSLRHYNGVYVLMEKIKRGDNRVAIEKLSADEDISGGYIFKYDNNNFDEGDKILNSTTSELSFIMTYPSKDNAQPASLDYLASYLGEMELALATENRSVWGSYIDESSFVDMFLITELTKNPDGYRGSYYFHKNAGSVLFAGPPWDFNEAYGMCCGYPIEGYLDGGVSNGISGGSAISPNGWRYNICIQQRRCRVDPTDGVSIWFQTLMRDPVFEGKVQSRWRALRDGPWSTETVRSYFSFIRGEIPDPIARNFDRWGMELEEMGRSVNMDTWREEMRVVESWTVARLEWMDSALTPISSVSTPPLLAAG